MRHITIKSKNLAWKTKVMISREIRTSSTPSSWIMHLTVASFYRGNLIWNLQLSHDWCVHEPHPRVGGGSWLHRCGELGGISFFEFMDASDLRTSYSAPFCDTYWLQYHAWNQQFSWPCFQAEDWNNITGTCTVFSNTCSAGESPLYDKGMKGFQVEGDALATQSLFRTFSNKGGKLFSVWCYWQVWTGRALSFPGKIWEISSVNWNRIRTRNLGPSPEIRRTISGKWIIKQ